MRRNFWSELLGWYGTIAIIGAYFLVSFRLLNAESAAYQLMNITGAIGIIVISLSRGVYQSVVLNVVWLLIAFVALIKILSM